MCLESIWSTSGCSCVRRASAAERKVGAVSSKQPAFSVEEREALIIPTHYISWTSTWFRSPHLWPFHRQQFPSLLINIQPRSIRTAEGPSEAGSRWLLSPQSLPIVVAVERVWGESWTLAGCELTALWQQVQKTVTSLQQGPGMSQPRPDWQAGMSPDKTAPIMEACHHNRLMAFHSY